MNLRRNFTLLIAFFSFCLPSFSQGLSVGDKAPDFTLRNLSSQPVTLSVELASKPVLLSFFATWCPGCREEYPVLLKLSKDPSLANALILGVNLRESPEAVASFLSQFGEGFPILLDSSGNVTTRLYKLKKIPSLVLIDKNSVIRYIGGALGEDELRARILAVLQAHSEVENGPFTKLYSRFKLLHCEQ